MPGQAEYLDMMRAVIRRSQGDIDKQLSLLTNVRKFIVRKAAEMLGWAPRVSLAAGIERQVEWHLATLP